MTIFGAVFREFFIILGFIASHKTQKGLAIVGKYKWLVIIFREQEKEIVPFHEEERDEAEKYFDRAQEQWSDVFLCEILKGPKNISFILNR